MLRLGKHIELKNDALSEQEIAKAVMYTISQFEKMKHASSILSEDESFDVFLQQSAQRICDFKDIIRQKRFDLKFQPIIDLKTGEVYYYEALLRFYEGHSTYESIVFCEDVGLSPELDLAVCDKLISYMLSDKFDKNLKFSVNLSGLSAQNDHFIVNLHNKLEPYLRSGIAQRLIFEITESSQITDLDRVNDFIALLQADGFKISLDDFGAGSASFQYLNKIHVDSVKIDGQYITNMLTSPRDRTMIANLVRMCADLDVAVVAERIETSELAAIAANMGIQYAQGYYFAKPLDEPAYKRKAA